MNSIFMTSEEENHGASGGGGDDDDYDEIPLVAIRYMNHGMDFAY